VFADVEKKSSMQSIPSSLNSLAQGCCALAPGEVLVPCGGILAPDHDGFFPEFAADVRASFDEAEPMVDGSGEAGQGWDRVMFDVCTFTCSKGQKKLKVEKSKKTLKLTEPSVFTPQQHSRNVRNASK
jgi:hypothetical protein